MRQFFLVFPIIVIFLLALVATGARSFLPGGLGEPAPAGAMVFPIQADPFIHYSPTANIALIAPTIAPTIA